MLRSGDFLNPHVPLTVVWTTCVPWPPSASPSPSVIKGGPKGEACEGLSSVRVRMDCNRCHRGCQRSAKTSETLCDSRPSRLQAQRLGINTGVC